MRLLADALLRASGTQLRLVETDGVDLDAVQAVEVEVRCMVRLERGKQQTRDFMVLSSPVVLEARARSVQLRSGREHKLSILGRESRGRLRRIVRALLIDAWLDPQS